MKVRMKRAMLFAVVALGGLLFGASVRADERPEPRYFGKPLAYWVERLQKCEKDEDRAEATRAIKAFGPDAAPAVPELVTMLDDRGQEFRLLVVHILCDLGPTAKAAVPALVKSLRAKTARNPEWTIEILGSIGPDAKDAVPVLLTATEDRSVRQQAVNALCKIHPVSKDILPAIQRAMQDELSQKGEPKWGAYGLVRELPPLKGDCVPLLLEVLAEKDRDLKYLVVTTLGEIGPPAKAACPALIKALEHDDSGIRFQAAKALWKIDKNNSAVPVLVELVVNPVSRLYDWPDVKNAVELLGEMGPAAKAALPRLEQCLERDQGENDRLVDALQTAINKIRADKPQK